MVVPSSLPSLHVKADIYHMGQFSYKGIDLQACPLLSAAVQKRLTTGLGLCKYTYGDLLLLQVCIGPTAVQSQTAFGNCPLLSAAVQNKLTAGLGHCKYT